MRKPLLLPALFLALTVYAYSEWQDDTLLGDANHQYAWVSDWAQLPEGMSLGNTHGCVIVDSEDNVYVNTDTENAVVVFDSDGKFVKSWGKELAGGVHGMVIVEEDGTEFVYMTHTGRGEAIKATLDGEILWTVGYPEESEIYPDKNRYKPTSIAVAPDGSFYVADGYGMSWIHRYDAERNYVSSFGGPGSEDGKLKTPHGIWFDDRGDEPRLLVADRENNRLQHFDLDGNHMQTLAGNLRRPCNTYDDGNDVLIADLAGRVTILNEQGELIAHIGDNPDPEKRARNGIPLEQWADGEFLSPHGACWDSKGNMYVVDWNSLGRLNKLARVRK